MKASRWLFVLVVGGSLAVAGATTYNRIQYAEWQEKIYHGKQTSPLTIEERRAVIEESSPVSEQIFWAFIGSAVIVAVVFGLLYLIFGEKYEPSP